jgi:Phosphotransferase enzyme family
MLDIVVAFRLWLGRKVFGFLGPKCIRISLNRIVKGPTLPTEAAALLFVAENTNIRVPKVYHTYDRKDGFYIEMEYIRGQTVEEMWATISVEEKDRIIKDLAACVSQLRQLEPKVSWDWVFRHGTNKRPEVVIPTLWSIQKRPRLSRFREKKPAIGKLRRSVWRGGFSVPFLKVQHQDEPLGYLSTEFNH